MWRLEIKCGVSTVSLHWLWSQSIVHCRSSWNLKKIRKDVVFKGLMGRPYIYSRFASESPGQRRLGWYSVAPKLVLNPYWLQRFSLYWYITPYCLISRWRREKASPLWRLGQFLCITGCHPHKSGRTTYVCQQHEQEVWRDEKNGVGTESRGTHNGRVHEGSATPTGKHLRICQMNGE